MLALLALSAGAVTPSGTADRQMPDSTARRTTAENEEPRLARRTHAVTTEGLTVIGASEWQTAGHQGAGVKVAIVDLGFDGWDTLPDGELPSEVETVAFDDDGKLDTGTDHGTQMAEIVHDVAPEADLVLITFSDARMTEMVDWLVA